MTRPTIICACGCGRVGPHAARGLVYKCYHRAEYNDVLSQFPAIKPRAKTLPRGCSRRRNCNRIQVALREGGLFIYLGLVRPEDVERAVAMYDAALAAYRQGADRGAIKVAAQEAASLHQAALGREGAK